MVTERDASGETPIADETVRRQIARLFGESLFGAWPELDQYVAKPRRRRWTPWLYRMLVLGVIAAGVWGGRQFMRPALMRQVDDQRGSYAEELQSFMNDGDLARAAQYLPLVRDGAPSTEPHAKQPVVREQLDPKDPQLDLMVDTEAKLYRFFDAKPERLRRIRPHLEGAEPSPPLRRIARLVIVSREERAARLSEIEQLHNDLPNRNDLEYVLATALEFRNESKAAREAWERSERLGPAWLGHRFEQAWFELHQDRKAAALKVARQILRVDPDSPWSKLAIVTFAVPKDLQVQSVRSDAAAPVVSPVQSHFELLHQSIDAGHRGDLESARRHLDAAAAAVNSQAPFLLDAFDWLIAEKLPTLARQLTQHSAWPTDSPVATAKLGRLGGTP